MDNPTIIHFDAASFVVTQLDTQILECVVDERLSEGQWGELLAWTHRHLLSAYIAAQLDKHSDGIIGPALRRLIHPCQTDVDMIREMVQGGVPMGPDLTFHCPPEGCLRANALARKLPVWLRRRVVLAAQRTRLHTQPELEAIWKSVERHWLVGAVAWFGLDDFIDAEMPATDALHVLTHNYLDAVHKGRGLTWTPTGVILQA